MGAGSHRAEHGKAHAERTVAQTHRNSFGMAEPSHHHGTLEGQLGRHRPRGGTGQAKSKGRKRGTSQEAVAGGRCPILCPRTQEAIQRSPSVLRLSELKLPLDHSDADLVAAIHRRLRLTPGELRGHRLVKRSVDARRRGVIALVYCLDLELEEAARRRLLRRHAGDPHLRPAPDTRYRFVAQAGPPLEAHRPVVVGAGPCGYFAALLLAQMGLRPLLLERGKAVKERTADTFGFWKGQRPFDPESNAQFGEGGAGTFSDGKLYSQVSEHPATIRKVLEELVAAGANPEILTLHHPHIGTFKLATVVRGLRARIEALGG